MTTKLFLIFEFNKEKIMPENVKLKSFTIKGYKSIKVIEEFEPHALNILIGPNGAGKSNFISFFKFLSWMLNSDGKLQEYISYLGGANDILHDGADVTKSIEAKICIETVTGTNEYAFSLMFAKPDRLVFREEKYRFSAKRIKGESTWSSCGIGHVEAQLPAVNNATSKTILNLLRKLIVYQFHNTSDTAPMRLKWSIADGRWLKQNGENLGSFLYHLQRDEQPYYFRIIKYIRLVLPFFDDFEFYDEFGQILLSWKENGTNKVFNAGQASDGMLRTIALISLLAQNPKNLPTVLFLDEPELGLHPSAIDAVAGLIKTASTYCQVFVATQSISLVNNFDLDDLIVIDRKGRDSEYHRPATESLQAYLEDFSTGEIWEKNIIGGRP
ncbi:putative ATPase [Mucilaginibacter sp. UYNi724]